MHPEYPETSGANGDELEAYLGAQLADPDVARAYAAARVPGRGRLVDVLCWVFGLPLIMGALIGMAYAIHGLALLCGWF